MAFFSAGWAVRAAGKPLPEADGLGTNGAFNHMTSNLLSAAFLNQVLDS